MGIILLFALILTITTLSYGDVTCDGMPCPSQTAACQTRMKSSHDKKRIVKIVTCLDAYGQPLHQHNIAMYNPYAPMDIDAISMTQNGGYYKDPGNYQLRRQLGAGGGFTFAIPNAAGGYSLGKGFGYGGGEEADTGYTTSYDTAYGKGNSAFKSSKSFRSGGVVYSS